MEPDIKPAWWTKRMLERRQRLAAKRLGEPDIEADTLRRPVANTLREVLTKIRRYADDHDDEMVPIFLDEATIALERIEASVADMATALEGIELMARDYLHVSTPQKDVLAAIVDQIGRIRITAAAALSRYRKGGQ
jgi:hypothetical protein